MSVLVRSDGTQFVMQAYRELLSAKKKTQVVQEIRLLVEQQGQYVRLFNKGQGQYEAVISTEPGYLLGESIWRYFNETENLIYCEALPDSAHILVVIVRQGSVYMDSQMLASNLQSELLPLMTGDLQYRIITSGNVPLRRAESFGTFRFPKELIQSFETLEAPLFPTLPALKSLQLQPLPLALKAERLNVGFSTPALVVLVLALMMLSWWTLTPKENTSLSPPLHQPNFKRVNHPYAAYFHALSSPAPDQQILEMMKALNELYFLPGWRVTKIFFDQGKYQVSLKPDGGEMRFLREWARIRHYQFHLTPQGVTLTFPTGLLVRPKPKAIYISEQVVSQLVDQLDQLLDRQGVSLGTTQRRGAVQEMQLTIRLENASPDLLDLVSRELETLPVVLKSITLNLHSGLMSGAIQLSVWGR